MINIVSVIISALLCYDIEMLLGMCMVAPGCNVSEQITCHRHKPMLTGRGRDATLVPVRTTHRKAYYREYSSLYDANVTATALTMAGLPSVWDANI